MPRDATSALLDAADRLFQRYGYRKTTVEDIAAEAGLSRGTVYLHFRNKEEIALAWANRIGAARCAALEEMACSPQAPADRLRCMMVDRVLATFDRAQSYTQSLDELLAALRPAILAQREANHEAEAAVFAGVIREGQVSGVLRQGDAMALGRLVVLATSALMPYSLTASQLGDREHVLARVEGLAMLLLHGLACDPERVGAR